MKRFCLATLVLIIAACGDKMPANQQKAEHLVVDYLKKTPSVAETYQSMRFDTLREEHDQYIKADAEGRKLDTLASALTDSSVAYKKKADGALMAKIQDIKKARAYSKMDSIFAAKSDSVAAIIQVKSKGYVGKKNHYLINHTYKINNSVGRLTEHTTTFWINSDLTKIEHTQEAN